MQKEESSERASEMRGKSARVAGAVSGESQMKKILCANKVFCAANHQIIPEAPENDRSIDFGKTIASLGDFCRSQLS